jgi:hypothetical protein
MGPQPTVSPMRRASVLAAGLRLCKQMVGILLVCAAASPMDRDVTVVVVSPPTPTGLVPCMISGLGAPHCPMSGDRGWPWHAPGGLGVRRRRRRARGDCCAAEGPIKAQSEWRTSLAVSGSESKTKRTEC